MRSTLTLFHGVVSAFFGGKCPYFFLFFLQRWHTLHVLTYFSTSFLIPCQCIVAWIECNILVELGWTRWVWYQSITRFFRESGMLSSLYFQLFSWNNLRVPIDVFVIFIFFLMISYPFWGHWKCIFNYLIDVCLVDIRQLCGCWCVF